MLIKTQSINSLTYFNNFILNTFIKKEYCYKNTTLLIIKILLKTI